MQNAIEVTHLSKHFGTLNAVNDVSFSVARGDVLGFLGPNGAGKSTTMKMITVTTSTTNRCSSSRRSATSPKAPPPTAR